MTHPTANNDLGNRAAQSAERALHSTQAALNGLADSLQHLQHDTVDAAGQALQNAENFAQRGARTLRDGSQRLLDQAHVASRQTRHYIEREPAKSVLIAAAAGAALMVLVSLLSRAGGRR